MTDPRIEAVRADKLVGRGSCAAIDECFDDADLIEVFEEEGCKTPKQALKWCYEYEDLHMEQALNQTSGEPDCPALAIWNEWQERKREVK